MHHGNHDKEPASQPSIRELLAIPDLSSQVDRCQKNHIAKLAKISCLRFSILKKKNTDSVWQKPTQYYGAIILQLNKNKVFPGGSDDNESACNEGDLASIP